jgi:long-chain fatty acid transport protein
MKKLFTRNRLALTFTALSASGLFSETAYGKNGPLPHGIGSQFGLGGAGTALAIEATNAESNPALLSQLDTHLSAFLINTFQTQSVDSSRAPAGNPVGRQTNILKNSPGGAFGGNYRRNEKWAMGFSVSGGSTNVKYNASTLNPAILTPSGSVYNNELVNILMLVSPTLAYQRSESDSYGFSVILGRQTLKTNIGTSPRLTQTTGNLHSDTATGVGARIGGLWKVNNFVSLGASAATPVTFTKFGKYRDIFSNSFDVPGILRAGVALHAEKTDYLFDIKQVFYANVNSLGKGLGWKNQTIFMLAAQHRLTPSLSVSAGYNYGNSPVRSNNVLINSLIVPIATHHLAAGVKYKLTKKWEISASAETALQRSMVDDGSGILGTAAKGTRLSNRDVCVLIGGTYHFS